MTFKSQTRIGLAHAFTIVYYLYASTAGILNIDIYGSGTCINRILYKLLNDRSRALYYLTGSYLVGNRIGQKTNYIHVPKILKMNISCHQPTQKPNKQDNGHQGHWPLYHATSSFYKSLRTRSIL
jgi:hypothetical protein